MNKIMILGFAVLFMMIGGCNKKIGLGWGKNLFSPGTSTNEIVTELIREEILTNTNQTSPDTNTALTESISGAPTVVAVPEKTTNTKPLPEEPVVGIDRTARNDRNIKDVPIEVPLKKEPVVAKTQQKVTYLKVGNDQNGQTVSKKKIIKITTVVFSPVKNGRYVDFSIYAVPAGSRKANPVLLTHVKNIDIINGQAQFTRYWNGKNINGDYIKKGKYRLYVTLTIKDSGKETIRKETRNWGGEKSYNIRLY